MFVFAAVIDNNRYDSLQFDVDIDSVLHGFGGYFYCLLYADIAFSMSFTPLIITVLLLNNANANPNPTPSKFDLHLNSGEGECLEVGDSLLGLCHQW